MNGALGLESNLRTLRVLPLVWHASALLALLVVPCWLVFGTLFWRTPGHNEWVILAFAATYLVAAVGAPYFTRRVTYAPIATTTSLVAAAGLSVIYAALLLNPSADFSRAVLGWGSVILFAVLAGHILAAEAWLSYAASALAVGIPIVALAISYVAIRNIPAGPERPRRVVRTISASQHILSAITYSGYFPPQRGIVVTGGALAPDPGTDGYLFARANGSIYRLSWGADGELRVSDSGLQVPLNFTEFSEDVASNVDRSGFRVADLLARREGGHTRIFVSHHYWKRAQKCFVARVSTVVLPTGSGSLKDGEARWETIFESEPCLPIGASRGAAFVGIQIGGNLEFLSENKLLVTVGDHQFDGWYRPINYVQDPKSSYGKTVLVDIRTRRWSIFTTGHRNQQGLTVDSRGRIWSTEHGPQGGDELNLLREGGNYGYPMRTYGTEYGSTVWPPGEGVRDDPSLIRPVFAWVPSIAPTDLVEVTDPAFHRWRGDLLIASLKSRAIWRVRIEGQRVVYAEPILVGQRIRDIAAGKGEFVLLTDTDDIVRITPDENVTHGAELFTLQCGGCHDHKEHRIAPYLKHIVGKEVASGAGYDYSPALRHLGGRWTEERLNEFLSDPKAYVPGTTMEMESIRDADTRQKIIAYIEYFY